MSKLVSIFLVLAMFTLCACSKTGNKEKTPGLEHLTLDELTNIEGNIYITNDEKYEKLANAIMEEVTSDMNILIITYCFYVCLNAILQKV